MNFAGLDSLHVLRQWQRRVPAAQITGCQNVAASSYHTLFVSPRGIMLQPVSAALVGCKGTSIYPGPAMDAENFAFLNRAMGFLGRNQELIFAATPDPGELQLHTQRFRIC